MNHALSSSCFTSCEFSITLEDITNEGVEAIVRGLTADVRLDELRFRNTTYRHEDDISATSESDGSTNSSMMCQSVISEGPDSLISLFKHLIL